MSDITSMELHEEISTLTNGQDVHFSYDNNRQQSSSTKKKKKKKQKANQLQNQHLKHAQINQPQDDYPTSRVIKQGPNGDVIVESLDDSHSAHLSSHSTHRYPHANIWDNSTLEEQQNLKEFWEQLSEPQKMELVKIDKESIMDLFKNESKKDPQAHSHTNCSCPHCGRRSNIIENELENIYDNHFDDIIDFIHEVRDINDLNALPGLLFGGFHMLDEEHRLQKRREKNTKAAVAAAAASTSASASAVATTTTNNNNDIDSSVTTIPTSTSSVSSSSSSPTKASAKTFANEPDKGSSSVFSNETQHGDSNSELVYQTDSNLSSSVDKNPAPSYEASSAEISDDMIQRVLQPKLFDAINNFDVENFRTMNGDEKSADLLDKLSSVREIITNFLNADKVGLDKGMAFLRRMAKFFGEQEDNDKAFSNFADSLVHNQSQFLQMMEVLSDSRTKREDLLREGSTQESLKKQLSQSRDLINSYKFNVNNHNQLCDTDQECEKPFECNHSEVHNHISDHEHEHQSDYESKYNNINSQLHDHSLYDYEHDHVHSHDSKLGCRGSEDDEVDDDEEEVESDTESDISEEEKMQEIRRLFLIQVIKLFQERLKTAYKEKLSQDRTRKLIEELEAEENAKREKEAKKLKQKEKAKEKKKLQQQAKEEEKRKKEEEMKQKEEELKRKQEEARILQLKRKEEVRLKREEEKKKRLEELKKREEEAKRKLEIQRKKDEEMRKMKEEERKKKAEELKKKNELEKLEKSKIQRELQKSQNLLQQKEKDLETEKLLEEQAKILENQTLSNENEVLLSTNQYALGSSSLRDSSIPPSLESPAPSSSQEPVANNPLLEQLYRAKPRNSVSNQDSFGMLPSLNSPTNPNSSILNGVGWENDPLAPPTPSSTVRNNFFSNGYASSSPSSIFGGGLSTNPLETSLGTNFNTNISLSQWSAAPQATTTRNGSIWGNNTIQTAAAASGNLTTTNLWGQATSTGPPNGSMLSGGVSGTSVPGTSVSGPTPSLSPHLVSNILPPVSTTGIDSEAIQQAAVQGYQILQNNQQLEFGYAPTFKLFQIVKGILGNNSNLNMNQFLMSCRNTNPGNFAFDYIYDDMGTVSHIRLSSSIGSRGNSTTAIGSTNVNGLSRSEILPSLGGSTFSQNSAGGSGGGLWN